MVYQYFSHKVTWVYIDCKLPAYSLVISNNTLSSDLNHSRLEIKSNQLWILGITETIAKPAVWSQFMFIYILE